MALTQQQIQASKDYREGKISSDEYKRLYIPNYNPAKDPTAGKNIQYQPNPVVEQRLNEQIAMQQAPLQQPIKPPLQQPLQIPTQDYSQLISGISDASRQANIAALQRAYQKSLGGLESERATIAPQFEESRSDIRRASMNQAKDFENFLATKGLARSGAAAQGEIASNVALTGAIGQSKTEEQRRLADIEKRRSELGTDLEFGIAQTEAQANLERMRAELQARQQADALAREDALRAEELARADALRAEEIARSDFGTTIAANYQDISALVDRLRASGAPQWQIDQAEAARQQKIMELNLDPRTGQPLPTAPDFSQTLRKWEAGLTLTPQEMQVIGATTPTKPRTITGGGATINQNRDFAFDLWKRLGTANDFIASTLGIATGTPYDATQTQTSPISYADVDSALNNIKEPSRVADLLVNLEATGQLANVDDNQLAILQNKYNVTQQEMTQAINRYNARTQGITLPSGNVIR